MSASLEAARYEAVIKVACADPQEKRARAIEEGIGYACALLADEYGRTADEIAALLERTIDEAQRRDDTWTT